MSRLFAAIAIATLVASPALAQSFDPHIGSGNLNTTVESGVTYLQPGPSGLCEVRRRPAFFVSVRKPNAPVSIMGHTASR